MAIIGLAARLIKKNPLDQFPMVAIAFNGSRVLGWAFNEKKTCPDPFLMDKKHGCGMYDHNSDFVPCTLHAEVNLIRKMRTPLDFDMLVLRFKRDGSLGVSKPCNLCSHRLRTVSNLNKVHYFDGEEIVCRRVREAFS